MAVLNKLITGCLLALCCVNVNADPAQAVFAEIDPEDPNDPWRQTFDMQEKIYEGDSSFQHILIFNHAEFGRVLALDGLVQTTEEDEFIYHEMLNHVPMLAHGNPRRVLIIGGGDGGSLREILRYKSVEKVTMVDLDGQVVQLCKEHLPSLSKGAFNDPRVELLIQDGIEFVKNCKDKFDVIICDTTDPVGPGKVLFSPEFYSNCKKRLNENGILATQNGVPFSNGEIITDTYNALSPSFKKVRFYAAPVPTYIGGFMAFALATNSPFKLKPPIKKLRERFKVLGGSMRYYTPEIHKAAFALPQYILDCIPARK